jgi:iron complex outermembrane receptor protein
MFGLAIALLSVVPPDSLVTAMRMERASRTLIVHVRHGLLPVSAASVAVAGLVGKTDADGDAEFGVPEGEQAIVVEREGFRPERVEVTTSRGSPTAVTVQLRELRVEESVTVVSITRSRTMVEDQALRVEALPQEEIEENSTVTPGSLTTLFEEIGGLRVQNVAPTLGGQNLRLHGLGGRYTQILMDELPLYGDAPDVFALLQVPPLDLAQVEVVKGAGSALYGGTALGGIINLVSLRPESESKAIVNQTLYGGTDAEGFASGRLGATWGYTVLGGANRQASGDLDHDGWIDLPGYRRAVLRPRLFWDDTRGNSLLFTMGGATEKRSGGTAPGALGPEGAPYVETIDTHRVDAGMVARFVLHGDRLVSLHASFNDARHDHAFGVEDERDTRRSASSDITLSGSARSHRWVVGAAAKYSHDAVTSLAGFDTISTAPGVFAQDECDLGRRLSLSANVRAD